MSFEDGDPPRRRRWIRSQRFALSNSGAAAEAEYRDTIVASRTVAGRDSYDAARGAWAKKHALEPDDGLYLCELRSENKTFSEIVVALEACDKSRADAVKALERLAEHGWILELPGSS